MEYRFWVLFIIVIYLINLDYVFCQFDRQFNITDEVRRQANDAINDSQNSGIAIIILMLAINVVVGTSLFRVISEDIDSLYDDDTKGVQPMKDEEEKELEELGPETEDENNEQEIEENATGEEKIDDKYYRNTAGNGVLTINNLASRVFTSITGSKKHENKITRNLSMPIPSKERGLSKFKHSITAFREAPLKRKLTYLAHLFVILAAIVKVILSEVGSGNMEKILKDIIN